MALRYPNPIMGGGATPSSVRRWRQIRYLTIKMENLNYGDDQLK
jgi:hypothetical protein